MAPVRIGINGMGRIGRLVLRHALLRSRDPALSGQVRSGPGVDIVAANDLASVEDLAYLISHDTVHRCHMPKAKAVAGGLEVGPFKIAVSAERDPAEIPWGDHGVDIVIESTGVFTSRDGLDRHRAGKNPPGHVILGAPGKGVDKTIVVGVNEDSITDADRVLSNASCTTNALAPVLSVLHKAFGFRWGIMGTTHAYTGGQGLVDSLDRKDYRRGRAAAVNLVPTSTGAAKAVALVIPELSGKIDGTAVRVPVPNGSLFDVTCTLDGGPSLDRVLEALRDGARSDRLRGILDVRQDDMVSSDILGDPHSSIVDVGACIASGPLVRIVGWYDNEWGYAGRLLDLVNVLAHKAGGQAS
ncbi:MAG: glyceraldehyde 3-phosphate dehydrogenase NAD-binding domain-containing protein [Nannocystaceae bacterium]|nr:type I glyceraldehyde-3-phosphate dehydrogenase [Myxococcales bacterium]